MLGYKAKVGAVLMAVVLLLPALIGCAQEEPKTPELKVAVSTLVP
jgi:hypothetical protein